MSGFQRAALDQALDIAGTYTINSAKTLLDEATGLGQSLAGQTGSAASITTFASGIVTITGVTGMTAADAGNFITISGAATGANNGTFLIVAFISATSVQYANAAGVAPDGNNGAIVWTERSPYSAEDDTNFERTDRKAIKGTTNFYDAIPTYQQPNAVGTNLPADLTHIAGKTTDAVAYCVNTGKFAAPVEQTLTDIYAGSGLKHADAVNKLGVPCFDAAPFTGDWNSCYVEVTDSTTGNELEVLTGGHAGEKIFGQTFAGSSTSPTSVEIHWYSCPPGGDITTSSTAYTWEQGAATANTGTSSVTATVGSNGQVALTGLTGATFTSANVGNWLTLTSFTNAGNNGSFVIVSRQSATAVTIQNHAGVTETHSSTWTEHLKTVQTIVDLVYGYNERLDALDQNAFRFPLVSGLVGDANLAAQISDLQQVIGDVAGDTSLSGLLTNLTGNFPFQTLSGTPTVVSALNVLNADIGDRTYTGSILTSAQTIAASLQALSNAITTSTVTRVIERLAAQVNSGASHLLPSSATYTLDGTGNGAHLWVYWDGLLRHPGTLASFAGNEYAETDTTHITPYSKIKAGSIIDFFIH